MTDQNQSKLFYVKFERDEGGSIESTTVSLDPPILKLEVTEDTADRDSANEGRPKSEKKSDEIGAESFEDVVAAFKSAMDGYLNFLPITLELAPHLAYQR